MRIDFTTIYNNPNAKRQIYTFGCSWTYGWDLEQEKTFTHLLGDEDTRFIIVEQRWNRI